MQYLAVHANEMNDRIPSNLVGGIDTKI